MLCYDESLGYLAATLILAIVFVEDIDILYNNYVVWALFIVFTVNAMLLCKENIHLTLLSGSLLLLVLVRKKQRVKHNE